MKKIALCLLLASFFSAHDTVTVMVWAPFFSLCFWCFPFPLCFLSSPVCPALCSSLSLCTSYLTANQPAHLPINYSSDRQYICNVSLSTLCQIIVSACLVAHVQAASELCFFCFVFFLVFLLCANRRFLVPRITAFLPACPLITPPATFSNSQLCFMDPQPP